MAAVLSTYGGGWFGDRSGSTGASSGLTRTATNVLAATMLVGVGTGRFVDDLAWLRHHRFDDVSLNAAPVRVPVVEVTPARTPAEDIQRTQEVLSPGISRLAGVFGVSRQAIYNWLKGEHPKAEHVARLRDLAQAADLLAEAGTPITGAVLKRKVIDGKNLFEIAHDGGSAREAAQLLVQILQRETEQRQQLAGRFAGRKHISPSPESDFPAENDVG